MFDERVLGRVDAGVTALAGLDLSTLSLEQAEQLLRTSQRWVETLQGVQGVAVREFEQRGGHQQAGCSTMGAWLPRAAAVPGAGPAPPSCRRRCGRCRWWRRR